MAQSSGDERAAAGEQFRTASGEMAAIRGRAARLVQEVSGVANYGERTGDTPRPDVNYVFPTFVTTRLPQGLGGLIIAARLGQAVPAAGLGSELDVIAAVFIGGASAMGGIGQVAGAVVGGFIMGVMNNGMSIMGVNVDWQQVVKGLVLLGAVIFDVYNKNKA
jgi:ABC-type xylose transport system permease subunit